MTKPIVRRDAGLFAQGFTKGRESKITHLETAAAKKAVRMAYLEKRISMLARWRRIAIYRCDITPDLLKQIDRAAKGLSPFASNPQGKQE
jgi:hypothetical protein